MANEPLDEKAIFNIARQIDSPDARRDYLRQVCNADDMLLERVQRLLQGFEEQASFLESPPIETPTIDQPITEQPGAQIGPYKLLQSIGEGGMGAVFMAEQKTPVQRKVALKLIKSGLDSRQVLARFHAERQALAMMDHPNIAKVFDAGTTETGRPYFVMELVNGIPLTQFCDEQRLGVRERLELFIPVCLAVQHAHHKGIIHRDLKPSNVLVTTYDGRPVPKLIDFGVAKATSQSLTEKTMFTQFGQIVGTFEYMSPEQAVRNQLDIDTRSDVYSLGVLLYELLTGEPPFDCRRLAAAGLDEILRIIRDEDPERPSTRLSGSTSLKAIAADRHVEPHSLCLLVRGELDWIVMKALEKERARRYQTPSEFAQDVQHYLADKPVVACPPSVAYRLGKFARRNKLMLTAVVLVAASMAIGLVGTSWQAFRARAAEVEAQRAADDADRERNAAVKAEARARLEKDNAQDALHFLGDVLEQAAPYREPDRDLKVRTLLDRAADRLKARTDISPLVEATIRQTLGRIHWGLGEFETAEKQLTASYGMHLRESGPENAATLHAAYDLAMLYLIQSDFGHAEPLFELVTAARKRQLGDHHPDTLRALNGLGLIYIFRDELQRAERLYQSALRNRPDSQETQAEGYWLSIMRGLGLTYLQQERFQEAAFLLSEVLKQQLATLGERHPEPLITKAMLATMLVNMGEPAKALPYTLETLRARQAVFGELNPHTLSSIAVLARLHLISDRPDEAAALLAKLKEQATLQRDRLPPFTIWELGDVGMTLLHRHQYADAADFLRIYLGEAGRKFPDGWRMAYARCALGACLIGQQQFAEADSLLTAGHRRLQESADKIPDAIRQKRLDQVAAWIEDLEMRSRASASGSDGGVP